MDECVNLQCKIDNFIVFLAFFCPEHCTIYSNQLFLQLELLY